MAAEVSQFYNNYINNIKSKAKVGVKKAVSKTYQDLFVEVEEDVKDIFENAVDKFYDDYAPTVYERSYSLYNLLQTERSSDGYENKKESTRKHRFRVLSVVRGQRTLPSVPKD